MTMNRTFCCLILSSLALLPFLSSAQTPGNIEAVECDPASDRWFVSNGSSLLVTEDLGENWSFFGEAQASHGMEVLNGHLYAIGDNVIRAYDLETADEVGSLSIPGVGFLNGMGSHSDGFLVVSDFSSGRIYTVDVTEPQQMEHSLLAGNFGATPNGVVIDEANFRAVVVCWGNNADILSVDLESGDVTPLVDGTGMGNLDGVDMDGEGRFYVSSWSPTRVTRFSADFADAEIVVTGADGLSNPADISYSITADLLGVANSGSDEVTFHSFAETNGLNEVSAWHAQHNGDDLVVSLGVGGAVEWTVHDAIGRVLGQGVEWLPAGTNRLPWPAARPGSLVVLRCKGDVLSLR